MAILKRLTPEQLAQDYTHYGRLYKIVPVYLGDPYGEAPRVAVRNWWPEWMLDAADWIWAVAVDCMQAINPEFEHPGFIIAIDGELKH
ncbi:hypothetical protein LMG3482_01899 [Achromobacter deleyi]|uniref:hypothetical protein n=1 Tax=Achromobacter deleyi TaxID=1353891 RepID=UPI001468ED0F|nr:hypothetical protein [Achromobacter deleyi]CAB3846538.1 hypothetical protein LMG3481_01536 [Achromobacter deleyi]CAB3853616.1 hypothetical protein LMG3482_01899 [Achromobacter deleyi]